MTEASNILFILKCKIRRCSAMLHNLPTEVLIPLAGAQFCDAITQAINKDYTPEKGRTCSSDFILLWFWFRHMMFHNED